MDTRPDYMRETVFLPASPFLINPAPLQMSQGVYLAFVDNQWWLVHPDVAESAPASIDQLCMADLYVGMQSSGRIFIFPVPRPIGIEGLDDSRYTSLLEVVLAAQKQWTTFETNEARTHYLAVTAPQQVPQPAAWPKCRLSETVKKAFAGRLLFTSLDVTARLPAHARLPNMPAIQRFCRQLNEMLNPDDRGRLSAAL